MGQFLDNAPVPFVPVVPVWLIVGIVLLVRRLPPPLPAQVPKAAPPGWYPQPDGTLRWWDGTRWTEHTMLT